MLPQPRPTTAPAPAEDELLRLQERIGYRFRSPALLERALTHSSVREQWQSVVESQRLEFLGDAILGFLVGEMIYVRSPNLAEGPMSRLRAALVQEATLAEGARDLGLQQALRLGKGEERDRGRDKPSIQADAYESLLAAVYLDGGIEAVRRLVDREFAPLLEREIGLGPEGVIEGEPQRDPKTALQEWLQSRRMPLPVYRPLEMSGPHHARRFSIEVQVGQEILGRGESTSRRRAEARAAQAALRRLRGGGRRGAVPEPGGEKLSAVTAARRGRRGSTARRGRAR